MPFAVMRHRRCQGKISDIIADDKICSVSIEENALILGTLRGFVHVVSFQGHAIRSFRSHRHPVRGVSVDNVGLNVARYWIVILLRNVSFHICSIAAARAMVPRYSMP